MPNQKRFVVDAVEAFPPGSRKIMKVSGREIGVFNVGGEFFALRNVCPHMGAPICLGRTRPHIIWDESAGASNSRASNSGVSNSGASEPGPIKDANHGSPAAMDSGNISFQREGEILKCPWHLWEFDLRTGKSMHDETLQVQTFTVMQEGADVVLYV